jgi:hypothetical protein
MIFVTLPDPGPPDTCPICERKRPLYVVWTGDEADHAHLCGSCLAAVVARAVGGELPELEWVVRVLTERNYGLTDDEREDLADVALTGVLRVREQLAEAQDERDQARAYVAEHVQGNAPAELRELFEQIGQIRRDDLDRLATEREEARWWARHLWSDQVTHAYRRYPVRQRLDIPDWLEGPDLYEADGAELGTPSFPWPPEGRPDG